MNTFIICCGLVYFFRKPLFAVINWMGNYPLPEWLNTLAMLFFLGAVPYLAVLGAGSLFSMIVYRFLLN